MTLLQQFFNWIGFDPIVLSGPRSDDELLYIVGVVIASFLGIRIFSATPLHRVARTMTGMVVAFAIAAFGISMAREYLVIRFIEPASGPTQSGTFEEREVRVAVPLLGLRSNSFRFPIDSQQIANANSADYLAESRRPENIWGLRASVALHWVLLVAFLTFLLALTTLTVKAAAAKLKLGRQDQ
jgi:hypothetical protein